MQTADEWNIDMPNTDHESDIEKQTVLEQKQDESNLLKQMQFAVNGLNEQIDKQNGEEKEFFETVTAKAEKQLEIELDEVRKQHGRDFYLEPARQKDAYALFG